MKLARQWRGVSGYMVREPTEFFAAYDERHGIGYPLVYLAITFVVVTVPVGLLSMLVNLSNPYEAVVGGGIIVVGLGGLFWFQTIAEALVAHIVAHLLGARGPVQTLEAYAFPAVVRYGLWWFPIVNIGLALYGWYLQIQGLSAFHDISTGRAAIAALVGLLLYVPLLLVAAAVIGSFVLELGNTSPV